jgi:glutamine synthetase
MATPKSVLELAKKAGAKMVDIKFVDTFGTWQHFTSPIGELTEETFAEGIGFDGSSIRGWKSIEASDMLAVPDPETAFIDPFFAVPTLSLTCTVAETGTLEPYSRDPRGIAQKAENISSPPALVTRPFLAPKPNFSSSTTFSSTPRATARSTPLIPKKPFGTPAATKCPTSATRSVTRKVTSPSPPPTRNRTSAPKWC